MKKTISIFASALLVLIAATSCSKQGDTKVSGATGDLKFTIDFSTELPEIPGAMRSSYTQSTTKPTTSWAGNIKDITILCVDASSRTVKAVKTLAAGSLTAPYTSVFQGIPAATYTIYAIANSGQSDIATGFKAGTEAWGTGTFIGKNIDNAILKLTQVNAPTDVIPNTSGYTCYNAPAEIFVGSKAGVVIVGNQETPAQTINLTRVIGLMRVRIDHTTADVNKDVDFAGTKGLIQVRRATQQWSLGTDIQGVPRTATNVIYVGTGFSTTEPTVGYETGAGKNILNADENITAWADVRMFPGGTSDAAVDEKFDLLISGTAKAGYKPADADELTKDTRVYWSGQVKEVVIANGILEVNCELKSAGVVTPPSVGTYGSLSITFTLEGWGVIKSTNVEM